MILPTNLLATLREVADQARDAFAARTGICVLHDRLKHPGVPGVVTLAVPGYRQVESYTCGFVAGLMVLHTFHPDADIDAFFHRVRPTRRHGASTRKVADALRRSGVGVSIRKRLGFREIRREIDAGFPILTCLKTGDEDVEHWVVIYGYGLKPNRLFIAGNGLPFFDAREISWETYLKTAGSGRAGLVCWGKG
ncbi:MAG: hypothetical protein KDN18_09100 [Verrucomicrobiae bacterium]|nr:hypothetical protein [Verrucomicrobiae bacterium]